MLEGLWVLTAGVVLRRVFLLVMGAIGVIMTVPETAARYLPENLGPPLAILITRPDPARRGATVSQDPETISPLSHDT